MEITEVALDSEVNSEEAVGVEEVEVDGVMIVVTEGETRSMITDPRGMRDRHFVTTEAENANVGIAMIVSEVAERRRLKVVLDPRSVAVNREMDHSISTSIARGEAQETDHYRVALPLLIRFKHLGMDAAMGEVVATAVEVEEPITMTMLLVIPHQIHIMVVVPNLLQLRLQSFQRSALQRRARHQRLWSRRAQKQIILTTREILYRVWLFLPLLEVFRQAMECLREIRTCPPNGPILTMARSNKSQLRR